VAEADFYDRMVADMLLKAGLQPIVAPPPGVECSLREGNGKQLLFLLNHTEQMQSVAVPVNKTILLGGSGKTSQSINLDRFGVAVIEI
jgi:beta-galactosidase GanA